MFKYIKAENIPIVLWFACIFYYMYGAGSYLYYNAAPYLNILSLYLIIKYQVKYMNTTATLKNFAILALISSFIGYLGFPTPRYSMVECLSYSISAYLACLASYSYIARRGGYGLRLFYFFFIFIYIIGVYWFSRTNALIDSLYIQNNGFYYALFALPFMLLYPNKIINIACILTSGFVCVFSTKRSALIAIVIILLVYIIYNLKGTFRTKIKSLFVIATLLAGGSYYLISHYLDERLLRVFDRVSRISEDGGSGRTDIASDILHKDIPDLLSFPELFIGNGFSSIQNKYNYTLEAAHNDILEVLYSYGSLGLILLFLFYYKIFKLFTNLKKEQPQEAMVALMTLLLIISYALMANIFFFFYYSIPLFITIGVLEGLKFNSYLPKNNSL